MYRKNFGWQNWRKPGEKFCPPKFLSAEILSDKVHTISQTPSSVFFFEKHVYTRPCLHNNEIFVYIISWEVNIFIRSNIRTFERYFFPYINEWNMKLGIKFHSGSNGEVKNTNLEYRCRSRIVLGPLTCTRFSFYKKVNYFSSTWDFQWFL